MATSAFNKKNWWSSVSFPHTSLLQLYRRFCAKSCEGSANFISSCGSNIIFWQYSQFCVKGYILKFFKIFIEVYVCYRSQHCRAYTNVEKLLCLARFEVAFPMLDEPVTLCT
jgi:hypothetical protein